MVMTSVILSCGLKIRDEHGMLSGVYIFVLTSVRLSGGMKMRDEHGMVREVYISGHDFCHSFRWYGNEGRAWKGEGGIHFCHDFCHTFRWYEKEGRAWND